VHMDTSRRRGTHGKLCRLFLGLGTVLGGMLFLAATGTAGTLDASWTAPTTSADGSPLADLASYRVYFGTSGSPCAGPSSVTVASSAASPAPGTIVTTRLNGLAAGTTYAVAISAIDPRCRRRWR
jgi:hypothetical protein